MPSGTNSLAITVSPVGEILPKGVLHGRMNIVVANTGKTPVVVTVTRTVVNGNAGRCTLTHPPKWMHVTPGSMHLLPGQSGHAVLTVNAPQGIPRTDVVAVFSASGVSSGNVKVADSVGTQMVIQGTSRAASSACGKHVAAAIPPVSSQNLPTSLIGVLGGAMLVLVLLAAVIIRAARKRGSTEARLQRSQERAFRTYENPAPVRPSEWWMQ